MIDSVDNQRREAIAARAAARRRAWEAGARPGWIVMDLDASLVNSHSEKHRAAPTYKHGFGFLRWSPRPGTFMNTQASLSGTPHRQTDR